MSIIVLKRHTTIKKPVSGRHTPSEDRFNKYVTSLSEHRLDLVVDILCSKAELLVKNLVRC